MKLRNKLVMMLTATMMTTCVPMVTFANDTSIDKTLILRKDDPVTIGKQYLTFEVDIKVTSPDAMEVYLEGDNIEFDKKLFTEWAEHETGYDVTSFPSGDTYKETVNGTEVTYVKRFTMGNYGEDTKANTTGADGEILVERTGDNKLRLILKGSVAGVDIFRLPLVYKVTDTGEATIEIKSGDGRIEETTLTLSKGEVGDKDLVAKITGTDIISIEGKGKLGGIEFSEIAGDQLSGRVIKITLDSSDIEFVEDQTGADDDGSDDSKFKVSSSLGLISKVDADHVKFVRSEEDPTIGYLIFDENSEWLGSSPGKVKIEGLNVEDSDGDVSTGELDATIELMDFAAMDAFEIDDNGDFANTEIDTTELDTNSSDAEKFNYFIGHKNDFSGKYALTWDDIDTADVSDKMSEVDDVIAKITEDELGISVETDADVIGGKWDEDDNKVKIKITDPTREFLQDNGKLTLTLEGAIFAPMTSELGKDAIEENADEDEFFTKIESDKIEDDLEDEEDFIKIEESNPNVAEVELDGLDESSSEFEFSFYVVGNPGYNGDITLTADGSKWDEPMTATVGKVTQPVEVNLVQQIILVENEKAPAMGMVTITETNDKMFSADDVIVFGIEDLDIEDAEVTADNGMQVDSKISDGHLLIQVQRRSNDPATITISDIKFGGTGYIAFGEYDAYIGGQGIHAANTFINFEESKSSKLVGKPDDADDWDENGDDYFNGEVNLGEFPEDIDEIFAVAFSLDNFVVSTLPMMPDVSIPMIPTPDVTPTPEPTPQPEDVAGPDGNYGLADTYIEISGGKAYVNSKEIKVNTEPKNIDGTTMVGVADLATLLGIPRDQEFGNSLTYHQETDGTGVVTIRLEDRRIIEVRTGSNKINISDYNSLTGTYVSIGNLSPAAQAARIIDGRMFVPMRQIGESLGFDVSWNSATKTAIFTNM